MFIGYLDINKRNISPLQQQEIIQTYADNLNLPITTFFQADNLRKSLSQLDNSAPTLLVANVLALGSTLQEIKDTLISLHNYNILIHLIDEKYTLSSAQALQDFIKAIDIAMTIRSSLLSVASKVSIVKRKSSGQKIGRPHGSGNQYTMREYGKQIEEKLKQGTSILRIARELNISIGTIYGYMKQHPNLEDNRKYKQ